MSREQQQRQAELAKIAKTQIAFKIGGLTEDNLAYAQQEIQALVRQSPGEIEVFLLQRLLASALVALDFPSASSAPSLSLTPSASPAQSALALRLLTSEIRRLARDPFAASKWTEGLSYGLNASAAGAATSPEEVFQVGQFIRKLGLHPLETFILLLPLIQLPTLGGAPSTNGPAPPGLGGPPLLNMPKRRAIARDAADHLRELAPSALHWLGRIQQPAQPTSAPGQPRTDESVSELSPVQLSKLLSSIVSDGVVEGDTKEALFSLQTQRAAVVAMEQRVGADLAAQIVTHCLGEAKFSTASPPTAIGLLHRLCPNPGICTPDLVRTVMVRSSNLGSVGHREDKERIAADMLKELVDLAGATGGEVGLDHVAWIQGVGEAAKSVEAAGGVRWSEVVRRAWDAPTPPSVDNWGLRMLGKIIGLAPSMQLESDDDPNTAGVMGVLDRWDYPSAQAVLLDRLTYLPYDSSPFFAALRPSLLSPMLAAPCHRVVSVDDLAASPSGAQGSPGSTVRGMAKAVEGSPWNVLELLLCVARLLGCGEPGQDVARPGASGEGPEKEREVREKATEIMERACRSNPELVMMALVLVERPWSTLVSDLAARLLASFLSSHPSHQLVFVRIWQTDPGFLLAALRDFYELSEINVTRVLDIASDLKVLEPLLDGRTPINMRLDVAALAARREFLNLEKWLQDNIAQYGLAFMRECLEFLHRKVRYDLSRQEQDAPPEPTTLSLPAPTVAVFLRSLRMNYELLPQEEIEAFKEIRTASIQLHPKLMSFLPSNEQEPGMNVSTFDPQTEAEVDAYYKRMYDQQVSIDQVLNELQRAKHSDQPHDHQFFACFLYGLFDEYKFFHTYPDKELSLTAALFGSLISERLIGYVPLGIAVRYVLDAIKNPPDTNWYRFGVQALVRFQDRLADWPQLAAAVARVEHLRSTHPQVASRATAVVEGADSQAVSGPEPTDLLNGTEAEERPAFTSIRADPRPDALGEGQDEPAEEVSDRILFLINNLAPSNFDAKVADVSKTIRPDHFAWFARYLVAQRVSIEPNNHVLYLQFLDALDLPPMVKEILNETFVRCAVMLNSEKTVSSGSERTMLKNLGAWLGALTLAKDRPIRHRNASFKDLLVEGFDNNRLIVAIPFVCKVLEQASKSRVFKPPNPWLMAILRLLVELYHFAELKLNLKFEIEVLCKALGIDLKDIEPTETLRNRPTRDLPSTDPAVLGPDTVATQARAAQAGELAKTPVQAISLGGQAGYVNTLKDLLKAALADLPPYLRFSPEIALNANAMWKRVVFAAIERAIQDIIGPVVERSVTIASISTRELTMKDFAMDGSEERLRQAAHLMVRDLAGSLALVTTKEPLRTQIVANIRSMSLSSGFPEQNVPEEEVQQVTADNLEIACQVVQRVATEKAVSEVDSALTAAYEIRRQHRERSNDNYWDPAAVTAAHYSRMLPEQLRLKLGGLDQEQLRIYEDFANPREPGQYQDASRAHFDGESAMDDLGLGHNAAARSTLAVPEATERLNAIVAEIERVTDGLTYEGLAQVPEDHELRGLLAQVPDIIAECGAREQATMVCAQKLVAMLFRCSSAVARDVFVSLLAHVCGLSVKVAHEVTSWLVFAEDDRKFNVPAFVALLAHGIVKPAELDAHFAKIVVRDFRPPFMDFVANLVRACIVTPESQILAFGDLRNTLHALSLAVQEGRATPAVSMILDELRAQAPPAERTATTPSAMEEDMVRERLAVCFSEWVRVYSSNYAVEEPFVNFIMTLQKHGVLKGEEISSLFFRVCVEVSVDAYIKGKAQGGTLASGVYIPVDAFAKLISLMIKYHADPNGNENDKAKVHYLNKILGIVALVMAHFHEDLGLHFQQKPFFRFYSSLLSNLNWMEGNLSSSYPTVMVAVAQSVNTVQPGHFPGFATSWMALISHRLLMPKLLAMKEREGWSAFHKLLLALFRFLAPFLASGKLNNAVRSLYAGALRILLVLLHDFPDFLAAYHHSLVNAIPPNCLQLTQIILAAFPSTARIPDPFAPGFALEQQPETRTSPVVLSDFASVLANAGVRAALDKAVQHRSPHSAVSVLKERFVVPAARASLNIPYDVPLISSTVLYLGVVGVTQTKEGGQAYNGQGAPAMVFKQLVKELEPEGRYYVLFAAVNQLRWPSSHTAWFSALLLDTFASAASLVGDGPDDEAGASLVREQITRVFLERLLVQRPHPFGLLHAFIRLLTLPDQQLLDQGFVKKSDEMRAILAKCSLSIRAQPSPGAGAVALPPTAQT